MPVGKSVKDWPMNDWLNRNLAAAKGVSFIKVDGHIYIKDKTSEAIPPADIQLSALEWVPTFSVRTGVWLPRVYEEMVMGNISGVIIVDRIFVITTEPSVIALSKAPKIDRR